MVVYELKHIFFRYEGELVHSPKNLGLFYSYESAQKAIQYFITQPGFYENQDAFSIAERNVIGNIVYDTVYEVLVYLHSKDYEFEAEIWLGLFGDETIARNKLMLYCNNNTSLVNTTDLTSEKIVNKCIIERKEWSEGFSIV